MNKQIRCFTPEEQRKIAKLWDEARRLMVETQYQGGFRERAMRFQGLADFLGAKRLLDASVGTGVPTLLEMDKMPACAGLYCSDADCHMLELLKKNFNFERVNLARWQDLDSHFSIKFDVILILGNSLPYILGWGGESADIKMRMTELSKSFAAIFNALKENGKFVFDLSLYGAGRTEIGNSIFFEVEYANGFRYWTIGDEKEQYTLEGVALTLEMIAELLKKTGFMNVGRVPENLQLDPLYYEMFAAYK